jgi:hypothetical protein
MRKFIVFCYYWPTAGGPLRLRSLRVKLNQRKPPIDLEDSKMVNLMSMNQTAQSLERRKAPRLKARCEAELKATLALLDNDAPVSAESLLFYGRTLNMSAVGLAFYLPSAIIDEHFCGETARLQMTLHLPTGHVNLALHPVRWVPVRGDEIATGYLMGAQILSIDDKKRSYGSYLRSIADISF